MWLFTIACYDAKSANPVVVPPAPAPAEDRSPSPSHGSLAFDLVADPHDSAARPSWYRSTDDGAALIGKGVDPFNPRTSFPNCYEPAPPTTKDVQGRGDGAQVHLVLSYSSAAAELQSYSSLESAAAVRYGAYAANASFNTSLSSVTGTSSRDLVLSLVVDVTGETVILPDEGLTLRDRVEGVAEGTTLADLKQHDYPEFLRICGPYRITSAQRRAVLRASSTISMSADMFEEHRQRVFGVDASATVPTWNAKLAASSLDGYLKTVLGEKASAQFSLETSGFVTAVSPIPKLPNPDPNQTWEQYRATVDKLLPAGNVHGAFTVVRVEPQPTPRVDALATDSLADLLEDELLLFERLRVVVAACNPQSSSEVTYGAPTQLCSAWQADLERALTQVREAGRQCALKLPADCVSGPESPWRSVLPLDPAFLAPPRFTTVVPTSPPEEGQCHPKLRVRVEGPLHDRLDRPVHVPGAGTPGQPGEAPPLLITLTPWFRDPNNSKPGEAGQPHTDANNTTSTSNPKANDYCRLAADGAYDCEFKGPHRRKKYRFDVLLTNAYGFTSRINREGSQPGESGNSYCP